MFSRALAAAVALMLLSAPDLAADDTKGAAGASTVYSGLTVEEASQLMQQAGYEVEVRTEGAATWIESRTKDGKYNFGVHFYRCDGQPPRCSQVQLRAIFNTTPEQQAKAVEYERKYLFGKVFASEDGKKTYVDHPMHLNGGITADNFINNLALYESVLSVFAQHIGW